MKCRTTAVLALSLALITGSAMAQPGNGPGRGMMCMQRFASFDANNDGKVTLAEFLALPHPRGNDVAEQMFASKDTNGDKVLTAAEFCPQSN